MENILRILDEATNSHTAGPMERQAAAELDPMMERVKDLTSLEFVDRIWTLQSNILCEEIDEHFSRGFRLGAQIMLGVLTPVSPD